MKFAKTFAKKIVQYQEHIPYHFWFNYKYFKKRLKIIINQYADIIEKRKHHCANEENECCVCLQSNDLMKTFCCHQYIHHVCLVHTLTFGNALCPLCRTKIDTVISFNSNDREESLDSDILSIVSYMYIDFMRFSSIFRRSLIYNEKMAYDFYTTNLTALDKICKKIDKHLAINTREHFSRLVEKDKLTVKPIMHKSDRQCLNICNIS